MNPVEVIEVESSKIACDGGDGALGHPRVFLTLSKEGEIDCPYCGRHFVLKQGAQMADAH
ncbi:MAG: zinc-finger domain-containing protein [Rhodospirillaceae bacterium]|nr:MAG: zinc-finger domain-containing protein [Rhodospirillaceae bacterium]